MDETKINVLKNKSLIQSPQISSEHITLPQSNIRGLQTLQNTPRDLKSPLNLIHR